MVTGTRSRGRVGLFAVGCCYTWQPSAIAMDRRMSERQSQIRRLHRRIGQLEQAPQDAEDLVKRVCEDLQTLRSQLGAEARFLCDRPRMRNWTCWLKIGWRAT